MKISLVYDNSLLRKNKFVLIQLLVGRKKGIFMMNRVLTWEDFFPPTKVRKIAVFCLR